MPLLLCCWSKTLFLQSQPSIFWYALTFRTAPSPLALAPILCLTISHPFPSVPLTAWYFYFPMPCSQPRTCWSLDLSPLLPPVPFIGYVWDILPLRATLRFPVQWRSHVPQWSRSATSSYFNDRLASSGTFSVFPHTAGLTSFHWLIPEPTLIVVTQLAYLSPPMPSVRTQPLPVPSSAALPTPSLFLFHSARPARTCTPPWIGWVCTV